MRVSIGATLFCLLTVWGVLAVPSADDETTDIMKCQTLLTSVRMEVTPPILHAICRDNSPITLVVRCGNEIWHERIMGLCNGFDLSLGEAVMDQLLPSSSLDLQLVKSGHVLDSARVEVITSQHLLHYRISVWGDHNTRFVLAIARECSMSGDNDSAVPRSGQSQINISETLPENSERLRPYNHLLKISNSSNGITKLKYTVQNARTSQMKEDFSNINKTTKNEIRLSKLLRGNLSEKSVASANDMSTSKPRNTKQVFLTRLPEDPYLTTHWWIKDKGVLFEKNFNTERADSQVKKLEDTSQYEDNVYARAPSTSITLLEGSKNVFGNNSSEESTRLKYHGLSAEGVSTTTNTQPKYTEKILDQDRVSENMPLKMDIEDILSYSTTGHPNQHLVKEHGKLPHLQSEESQIIVNRSDNTKLEFLHILKPYVHLGTDLHEPHIKHIHLDDPYATRKRSAENDEAIFDEENVELSNSSFDKNLGDSFTTVGLFAAIPLEPSSPVTIAHSFSPPYFTTVSENQITQTEILFLTEFGRLPTNNNYRSADPDLQNGHTEPDYMEMTPSTLSLTPSLLPETEIRAIDLEATMRQHTPAAELSVGSSPQVTMTSPMATLPLEMLPKTLDIVTFLPSSTKETLTSTYRIQGTVELINNDTIFSDLSPLDSPAHHNSTSAVAQVTPFSSSPTFIYSATSVSPWTNSELTLTVVGRSNSEQLTPSTAHTTLITQQTSLITSSGHTIYNTTTLTTYRESNDVTIRTSNSKKYEKETLTIHHVHSTMSTSLFSSSATQAPIISSQMYIESTAVTSKHIQTNDPSPSTTGNPQLPQPPGVSTVSQSTESTGTPQARNDDQQGLGDDSFWPAVAALVIGIPAVIVLVIAITVIHRKRLAQPAHLARLGKISTSLHPSL